MGGSRHRETIVYFCELCAENKNVQISPKDRKWRCECGALYVITLRKMAGDIMARLHAKTNQNVAIPQNSFSIWSFKGNPINADNTVLLVAKPETRREK